MSSRLRTLAPRSSACENHSCFSTSKTWPSARFVGIWRRGFLAFAFDFTPPSLARVRALALVLAAEDDEARTLPGKRTWVAAACPFVADAASTAIVLLLLFFTARALTLGGATEARDHDARFIIVRTPVSRCFGSRRINATPKRRFAWLKIRAALGRLSTESILCPPPTFGPPLLFLLLAAVPCITPRCMRATEAQTDLR